MHRRVRIVEASPIGRKNVGLFLLRNQRAKCSASFGEKLLHPGHEPVDFRPCAGKYTAQNEAQASVRMRLAIGKRQRAAPRAAEQYPPLDASRPPQYFQVGNQVLGRVRLDTCRWPRPAGAALVDQDDPPDPRVEKAAIGGHTAGAGAAMQKHHRYPGRVAAFAPIEGVAVTNIKPSVCIGVNRRIEFTPGCANRCKVGAQNIFQGC